MNKDRIKVVVIDDHPIIQDGMSKILNQELDIECIGTASDGNQGFELIKKLLPDIAIVDIAMPGLDGIGLSSRVRNTCPNTKVIIMSAHKYSYYVLTCMKAGVRGYLLKDTTADAIVNAVRMVYQGQCIFDTEVLGTVQHTLSSSSQGGAVTVASDLGERKIEILRLVASGLGNKEIGNLLNISSRTVAGHLSDIFGRLGVDTRTKAILYALKEGIIDINDVKIDMSGIAGESHMD